MRTTPSSGPEPFANCASAHGDRDPPVDRRLPGAQSRGAARSGLKSPAPPYSFSTSRTDVSGVIPPCRRANVFAPFCSHSPATHLRAKSSHWSLQSPSW